jgi:TonB family protein
MNWFSYLIQVNLYLTISVAFYWIVLRKETFHEINRSFLLGSSLLAFLIPFWQLGIIQDWFVTEQVSEAISVISLEEFSITAGEAKPRWSWNMLGATIYFIGFGYGLLRFSVALFKLQQLLRIHSLDGQAFSVFGKVFIDKNLPDYETIRNHEEIHSRQFHSVDVFWFELVTTVCWFNPIAHLLRKEIKLVHELIADEYASSLAGKKRYAEVLVATHFRANANVLINNFYNHSILKRRIMKLLQAKSKKRALWKYAFATPLFLGMLILSAASKANLVDLSADLQKKLTGISTTAFDIIRGRVLDTEGNPLPGASVVIKGTNTGTSTDQDGYFELGTVDPDAQLAISFAGFNTAIISVKSAEDLKIILTQSLLNPKPTSFKISNSSQITKNEEVFTIVEAQPEFPGGIEAMYEFINENMKYPEAAERANIEGHIYVKFVVQKDGSIGKTEILKGLGFGCDQEVFRILKGMPKWSPGIQNGKPVNVWFSMRFIFQLDKKRSNSPILVSPDNGFQMNDKVKREFMQGGQKVNPLFIVDGKEMSDISHIDPDQISFISVIKGEKALNHSGEKGKNGVVIITLKK